MTQGVLGLYMTQLVQAIEDTHHVIETYRVLMNEAYQRGDTETMFALHERRERFIIREGSYVSDLKQALDAAARAEAERRTEGCYDEPSPAASDQLLSIDSETLADVPREAPRRSPAPTDSYRSVPTKDGGHLTVFRDPALGPIYYPDKHGDTLS